MSKKGNKKSAKRRKTSTAASGKTGLPKNRMPIIYFVLKLGAVMVAYFWIYNQTFFDAVNLPVVKAYAWIGSKLLNIFGQATTFTDTFIANDLFSMDISKGCDAITPTVLFMAAVLAFPMPFKWKIPALLIAPPALALLNVIRILSLFLIGAYAPSMFEFAHIELWQVLFIVVCFIGWVYWLIWANKKKSTT